MFLDIKDGEAERPTADQLIGRHYVRRRCLDTDHEEWMPHLQEALHEMDEYLQRNPGQDNSPRMMKKRAISKPRLTIKEQRKREGVLAKYRKARDAGVSAKDFCQDEQISYVELRKWQNWSVRRRERGGTAR